MNIRDTAKVIFPALAIIWMSFCTAHSQDDKSEIGVLPFRFQLISEKVGKAKLGIPCFPSRKLMWSDLSRPNDAQIGDRVAADITSAGKVAVALASAPWSDNARWTKFLRGTLISINLNICVPYLGVGEMNPKGVGEIQVKWEEISRDGQVLLQETHFEALDIAKRDPRSDGSILLEAIGRSSVKFVDRASAPKP